MIYAICTQSTAEVVKTFLEDADLLQIVKDCRESLTEAKRLPVATLILDVDSLHNVEDLFTYRTTVRQCPRIIILAPFATPGNKMIGQIVAYGIYDIVSDLDRLGSVISGPTATIVQAARWIVRDQTRRRKRARNKTLGRRGGLAHLQKFAGGGFNVLRSGTIWIDATVRGVSENVSTLFHSTKKRSSAFEKAGQDSAPVAPAPIEAAGLEQVVSDTEHVGASPSRVVPIEHSSTISSLVPSMPESLQPIKHDMALPEAGTMKSTKLSFSNVTGILTRESWELSRSLVVLSWRIGVLAVQLFPYALIAEMAVLLGYIPPWFGDPAQGYWSVAHAMDPHIPTIQALWHYGTRMAQAVGLGGSKA